MFDQKEEFIQKEVLGSSIRGAFQHVKIYKDNAEEKGENGKAVFRENARIYLASFEEKYRSSVSQEKHINNIKILQENLRSLGNEILIKENISFGVAQKLLNLFLKYEWCLGKIDEPPHCPVDSIVISGANRRGTNIPISPPWSRMNEAEYRHAIEEIKIVANKQTLAMWELSIFNASNPAYGRNLSMRNSVVD